MVTKRAGPDHLGRRGTPTARYDYYHHAFRVNGQVKVDQAQLLLNKEPLLELSYAPATTIRRINLG